MDGKCGSDALSTITSTVQQQVQAGSNAKIGSLRPVSLQDFREFTQAAADEGVQLACPCTQTNIAFETFSAVVPKQIGLCESMLGLFYDPMSENATTAK